MIKYFFKQSIKIAVPLIAHTNLPTFSRLAQEGELILSPNRANTQTIRELHIGLLNMMPDTALEATERQFFRLIGQSNHVAQFFIHPFSLSSIKRGGKAKKHIEQYYQSFSTIKTHGLDALIITGAHPDLLTDKKSLNELESIVNWASDHVASSLFSCFATHAVMKFYHQQTRTALPKKCWGVFAHQVTNRIHPLVSSLNTRFNVPHSRFNQISKTQFEQAGLSVLVESSIGVHLAVSHDLLRMVFLQGHPEYDAISLLKEYKREVLEFTLGNRDYPPLPKHYFTQQASAILQEFKQKIIDNQLTMSDFPEKLLCERLDNTWRDSAIQIMNNWIGCVYQTTNENLHQQFMAGIDKNNPLNLPLSHT